MRNIIIISTLILLASFKVSSQESKIITLKILYDSLEENHPVSSIKTNLMISNQLDMKNISTSYLPRMNLNSSVSWQSDVTQVEIPFPGVDIPTPDKDQYRMTLDVTQLIWDGGISDAKKRVSSAQLNTEIGSINNELYQMKEKINDTFFSIVLLNISNEQLILIKEELIARLETLKSGVREGLVLESTTLSIEAEIARVEQKILEIPFVKLSLIHTLRSIAGIDISADDSFVLPDLSDDFNKAIVRPELESFNNQKLFFDERSQLYSRSRMPMISGFVTSGYGKPGLNMLSNNWDTYLIVGARLSWNIWDWNVTKREREKISIQKNTVDLRRKSFEDGLEAAVFSTENRIAVLQKQLQIDDQVIDLLEKVKKRSESQLSNGLISSTEYLTDFNATAKAKLEREQRKINLVREKTRLRFLLGIDI